jgi:Flp pilus assembly protein TadD
VEDGGVGGDGTGGVGGDDDLAGLLAEGERAAFHGRPAAGVPPLQRAVEAAHARGRDDEATAAVWLLGVCLGAAGRYGAALEVLRPLAEHTPDEPERRVFSSLASSTVASVHRQLGRHADGRRHDERALALAGEVPEPVFDALLGLAADAVGLDDHAAASARLAEAEALAATRADWWRQRVRVDWVAAEVALLGNDAAEATRRSATAVALAEGSGAPRHVAKGLLFLGVAQVTAGQEAEAAPTLRRAASLAESLGALPLVWPSRAVLGALMAGANPAESQRSLAVARQAIRTIAADLPPDLAAEWLARPDVATVLAGRGPEGDGSGA